jgi:hypothetical protein
MGRHRLPKNKLHETPVKVRLDDQLEAFFNAKTRRRNVPRAIIMREMLVDKVNEIKAQRSGEFVVKAEYCRSLDQLYRK